MFGQAHSIEASRRLAAGASLVDAAGVHDGHSLGFQTGRGYSVENPANDSRAGLEPGPPIEFGPDEEGARP